MLLLQVMTTSEFIEAHRNDDVATLALRCGGVGGVDMPYALAQISGWQTAKRKLPTWAETEGIAYPASLSMEQCSSELTAIYKRAVTERLLAGLNGSASDAAESPASATLVDLTGGFGVDFAMLAPLFARATYVERSQELCGIVGHNLPLLGVGNAQVVEGDSADYLSTMPLSTVVYADPARRDRNGRRAYAIADCEPNVLSLMPELVSKAEILLLKLSPMLDISQAVAEIESEGMAYVAEAHVVAVRNECKELLLVIRRRGGSGVLPPLKLLCANDDEVFVVENIRASGTLKALNALNGKPQPLPDDITGCCLYEPNAAVMKAGCFAELGRRFGVRQLDNNSHLFVSRDEIGGFPGRKFFIRAVATMRRGDMKCALKGVERANVAVRNFPMTAETLRKRLKLKDGGDTYVFGTTVKGSHILLVCHKQGSA